jgi:hypothetical protein
MLILESQSIPKMNLDDDDFEMGDRHFRRDDDEGEEWKTQPLNAAARDLMKVANQIRKTVMAIVETIPDSEEEPTADYRTWMIENAHKLLVKISGAMATRDYILMSENAVIIKIAARELLTQTSGLEMFGYENQDYLNTLRIEIEEFRKLFIKWVRAFVREEPIWPDGWGLFYSAEDIDRWNSMNPDEHIEE